MMSRLNVLNWIGGKFFVVDVLYDMLPNKWWENVSSIIEVFGGGGSFLLNFPTPLNHEIRVRVYNDIDGGVSALFYCLLHPELYQRFVDRVRWNVSSRWILPALDEESLRLGHQLTEHDFLEKTDRLIAAAVTTYALTKLAFAGILTGNGAKTRFSRTTLKNAATKASSASEIKARQRPAVDLKVIEAAHDRISREKWIIERRDFREIIADFDQPFAFFYLDPPYYDKEKLYRMPFSKEDHEDLAELLMGIKGKFLLSYNDCPEVRNLYEGQEGVFVWDTSQFLNDGKTWKYMSAGSKQEYRPTAEGRELLVTNYPDPLAIVKKKHTITLLGG